DQSGQVRIWDWNTGRPLHAEPLQGPSHVLAGLAFRPPDGRLLAAADREQLKVWDVRSGQEVLSLRGAPPRGEDLGFNPKVAWAPDGKGLAALNWNTIVSVWEGSDRSPSEARQELRAAAQGRAFAWHLLRAGESWTARDQPALGFHLRHLEKLTAPDEWSS